MQTTIDSGIAVLVKYILGCLHLLGYLLRRYVANFDFQPYPITRIHIVLSGHQNICLMGATRDFGARWYVNIELSNCILTQQDPFLFAEIISFDIWFESGQWVWYLHSTQNGRISTSVSEALSPVEVWILDIICHPDFSCLKTGSKRWKLLQVSLSAFRILFLHDAAGNNLGLCWFPGEKLSSYVLARDTQQLLLFEFGFHAKQAFHSQELCHLYVSRSSYFFVIFKG